MPFSQSFFLPFASSSHLIDTATFPERTSEAACLGTPSCPFSRLPDTGTWVASCVRSFRSICAYAVLASSASFPRGRLFLQLRQIRNERPPFKPANYKHKKCRTQTGAAFRFITLGSPCKSAGTLTSTGELKAGATLANTEELKRARHWPSRHTLPFEVSLHRQNGAQHYCAS